MDKPILFSAPMVRAILDGRKTVTRRGLSKSNTFFNGMTWPKYVRIGDCNWQSAWVDAGPSPAGNTGPYLHVEWPYGKLCDGGTDEKLWARIYPRTRPGDQLWVQETWRQAFQKNNYSHGVIYYADKAASLGMDEYSDRHEWCPPSDMPRDFSRITLRVTAVKVERLQDISHGDAKAEGVDQLSECRWRDYLGVDPDHHINAVASFASLWESINGPGAWEANPWVAAYSFERVKP